MQPFEEWGITGILYWIKDMISIVGINKFISMFS